MQIFWINLDTSIDRKNLMEIELNKTTYKHTRFSAITPYTLPSIINDNSRKISKKEYACLCSHIFVLKQCLEYDDEWFCIMEDDMKLNTDVNFEQLIDIAPKDAEILQLFIINPGKIDSVYKNKIKWIKWIPHVYSTGIYLINKKGIEKILNTVLNNNILDLKDIKTNYQVDHLIYPLCNTYISTYPIAIPFENLISTINTNNTKMHKNAINKILNCIKDISYNDWIKN